MNFNCAVFYCMNCKRDIVVDSDQTLTWCCKRSISALPYYLDACGELEKTAKWLREEKQTEILFVKRDPLRNTAVHVKRLKRLYPA